MRRAQDTAPSRGSLGSGSEQVASDLGYGRIEDDATAAEAALEIGAARLPMLPRGVEATGAELGEGIRCAREMLAVSRPEPDDTLDPSAMQRWVDGEYLDWLRARGASLRRAHDAFEPANRGATGARVVAFAVLGVMLAQLADAVATMPLPRRVDDDDTLRLRFRDAFVRAARPLFVRAADAFGACSGATVRSRDASLTAWQRYCDEAIARLDEAPRPLD